ncbi:hypothetical protein LCGC14_2194890, partial [marine sediment metagenome]
MESFQLKMPSCSLKSLIRILKSFVQTIQI